MTIDEIIEGLQFTIDMFLFDPSTGEVIDKTKLNKDSRWTVDACENAIKLLKQKCCEDTISRQAVVDQTYLWSKDEFLRATNPFDYLRKRINSLPPVIPRSKIIGQWINQWNIAQEVKE